MWNFEYFGQINTDWIHRGFSGWDFESYGQFNIEQMIVMAHVNEVRTFYLDWNTSVLFRTAEWLKCRTAAFTRNTHIIYFCEWIPEFRALGTNRVSQICIVSVYYTVSAVWTAFRVWTRAGQLGITQSPRISKVIIQWIVIDSSDYQLLIKR